jgi:hypothetical protein
MHPNVNVLSWRKCKQSEKSESFSEQLTGESVRME